jgi:predicted nuclease of predicted toxin-antitoxin system
VRFLVDASLPRSAASALRALGHDAVDVRDIGIGGAHDDVIATHARQSQRALVTRDFDFADTRNYPPDQYGGIVVLDLPNHATAPQVVGAIESFVRNGEWLLQLPGRLAIVESWRVRFRPARTD